MADLPLPPGAASVATAAPVTASTTDEGGAETKESSAKAFGPSETAGGDPIPTPEVVQGVDATVILTKVHAALTGILAEFDVTDIDDFIARAEAIDKGNFPGNKHGRVSYATLQLIGRIRGNYELLTKQRGASQGGLKAKLAEKTSEIDALKAKLDELLAQLAAQKVNA
jgi:hypothetical protein